MKKNYESIIPAQQPKRQAAIGIDRSTSYTQKASPKRPSHHSYELQLFVAGQDPFLSTS